jgi:site-specific recombinase XerD
MVVNKVTDLGLSDICLRDAGKGFLISLRASNRYSPNYLEGLERTLALVTLYAEERGWPNVPYLTTSHIEEYLAYFQERPIYFGERYKTNSRTPSQGYIEVQYRRLKRCFGWLVERDHIKRNPLALIPHSHVDEKVVATVAQDDMMRLLELVDPRRARNRSEVFRFTRDRAVLYVLWDTPSRRNEIAGLTVNDVDLDAGAILVMGKGRKQRWMPVGSTVQELLWGYLQVREPRAHREPALWVLEGGRGMQPNWLYLMLKRLGQRAGVPNLHTHRFRHTYAINALEAGMNERELTVNMGTKRIPDTYFRTLGEKAVAKKHREISPADRLERVQVNQQRDRGPGKGRGRL